ncbi:MAG: glycosyltransferase [Muribaculaceae bacterium]|nr:glycosyltransferase [Muribaculaceae bacterium]
MRYLASQVKKLSHNHIRIIAISASYLTCLSKLRLSGLYKIYIFLVGLYLKLITKRDDVVFLMEYLFPAIEMGIIAKLLKNRCHVIALAHLVPKMLTALYRTDKLKEQCENIERLYVLGSSLKQYLIDRGVSSNIIRTTFHYVDTDFYHPDNSHHENKINVISIGNMDRDYEAIKQIASGLPDINFTICCGKKDLSTIFPATLSNVRLIGYLTESELRTLMQSCDVSLNAMNDTIGSNVITTSLACGLVVIASDVGSIRDYIEDGKNGYLFRNPTEAIEIINNLSKNWEECENVKYNARLSAAQINIAEFVRWFDAEISEISHGKTKGE